MSHGTFKMEETEMKLAIVITIVVLVAIITLVVFLLGLLFIRVSAALDGASWDPSVENQEDDMYDCGTVSETYE